MDVAPKVYCAVCVFEDKHQAEENAIKEMVKLVATGGKYCLVSFIAAVLCLFLLRRKAKQREHQYGDLGGRGACNNICFI